MKKKCLKNPLLLLFAFSGAMAANAPTMDMNAHALAVEYKALFRGQVITEKDVPSYEKSHSLSLRYAPIPYLLVTAGAGLEQFTVDPYQQKEFIGNYDFSPNAGLSLLTPLLFDIFQLTIGVNAIYLNSSDDNDLTYSGAIVDPFLGLGIFAGKYAGLEIGGKGHFINGSIKNTESDAEITHAL